jgi:hypothetical protein
MNEWTACPKCVAALAFGASARTATAASRRVEMEEEEGERAGRGVVVVVVGGQEREGQGRMHGPRRHHASRLKPLRASSAAEPGISTGASRLLFPPPLFIYLFRYPLRTRLFSLFANNPQFSRRQRTIDWCAHAVIEDSYDDDQGNKPRETPFHIGPQSPVEVKKIQADSRSLLLSVAA